MLDTTVTLIKVTHQIKLETLLKIAEARLNIVDGIVRSCDWIPLLLDLTLCDFVHTKDTRIVQWLLTLAHETASELTLNNGTSILRAARWEGKARIRRYNRIGREHTLAIAMLVRKYGDGRELNKKVRGEVAQKITTDAVIAVNAGRITLPMVRLEPLTKTNPFETCDTVDYKSAVVYLTGQLSKAPSQAFIYKFFPKARKHKFSKPDCDFLIKRLSAIDTRDTL